MLDVYEGSYTDATIKRILHGFDVATRLQPKSAKAWHCLSLAEFRLVGYYDDLGEKAKAAARVTSAVRALFLSLVLSSRAPSGGHGALVGDQGVPDGWNGRRDGEQDEGSGSGTNKQTRSNSTSGGKGGSGSGTSTGRRPSNGDRRDRRDRREETGAVNNEGSGSTSGNEQPVNDGDSGVLIQANVMRLLSLLFDYGHLPQVNAAFAEGMGRIGTDVWIRVIPQLIARIDIGSANIRELLKEVGTASTLCFFFFFFFFFVGRGLN